MRASRSRQAGRPPSASRSLAGAALKTRLFIAIAHGALVSRVPDNGNFWPGIQPEQGRSFAAAIG